MDGYVPAVCVPEKHEGMLCVQMWHALGAIKKFGYQALDTPDGRSSRAARDLRMHRGYDVVIAGLPGAVPSFSEAFDCPSSVILPLGLPRIDYILSPEFSVKRDRRLRAAVARLGIEDGRDRDGVVVLYAPTLRRGVADGSEWFVRSVRKLQRAFSAHDTTLVVAGHPLQADASLDEEGVLFLRDSAVIDVLDWVDYVITDYSAVAFEAAVASKKVLFYVPDINEYRLSPGLNIDPCESYPELTFDDAACLAEAVARDHRESGGFIEPFDERAKGYLGELEPGCIQRIIAEVRSLAGVSPRAVEDDDGLAQTAV